MQLKLLQFALVFVFLSHPTSVVSSSSLSSPPLRGVSPQDAKYYSSASEVIKCKDGSKKINRSQINDDFCDCPDGSDEPGTSACPDGRFYCRNAGHTPAILFSSRVNDVICDCCDGSDEYDGKTTCPNTCWEAGKVARDSLKKKIAMYQQGVKLRKKQVEQAKLAFAKEKSELSKLRSEEKTLKKLVQKLKGHEEHIEKAEEKERLEKEKEESLRKESGKKSDQENKEAEEKVESEKEKQGDATSDEIGSEAMDSRIRDADDSNVEGSPTSTAEPHETAGFESTEGLSKEELGRLVASRWTGEKTDQESETAGDAKADEDHGLAGEDNGASASYESAPDDESFESGVTAPSSPSWHEKVQNKFKNLLQVVQFFRAPLNMSDAARVRKEYDESSAKLSDIQSRISTLSEKLEHDFGPEKEFYSLYDHCFETKQNKYVYKVCPFKKSTQEEGYRTTRLGEWEKFDDAYKVMVFSNGDMCWNGPDRIMKVKLQCGLKNELTDVDEPSRCEYAALLSTPSLCHEKTLKELQQELVTLNSDQKKLHDEL